MKEDILDIIEENMNEVKASEEIDYHIIEKKIKTQNKLIQANEYLQSIGKESIKELTKEELEKLNEKLKKE